MSGSKPLFYITTEIQIRKLSPASHAHARKQFSRTLQGRSGNTVKTFSYFSSEYHRHLPDLPVGKSERAEKQNKYGGKYVWTVVVPQHILLQLAFKQLSPVVSSVSRDKGYRSPAQWAAISKKEEKDKILSAQGSKKSGDKKGKKGRKPDGN
jgi:hypothetical protein